MGPSDTAPRPGNDSDFPVEKSHNERLGLLAVRAHIVHRTMVECYWEGSSRTQAP